MRLALILLLPAVAAAAVWPDMLGPYHRASDAPAKLADQPLWDEFGLKNSEAAVYENGKQKFTATLYQLSDSTAGLAAFERRPALASGEGGGRNQDQRSGARWQLPARLRRLQARRCRADPDPGQPGERGWHPAADPPLISAIPGPGSQQRTLHHRPGGAPEV